MMRHEGAARLEIIITALFAFVVYLQAQNAHQYATLLQALDRSQSNQAELLGLYRRTFEAARSTPETQPHHFYQEHDEIARNAPRAPTRNLHDRHYTGPCELTLPRPAAGIWLQPMEPKHDHHQHGAAIIAVILALAIAMLIPSNNENSYAAYSNARPEHQTVPNQDPSHKNPDRRKRSDSQHPRARVNGQRAPRTNR